MTRNLVAVLHSLPFGSGVRTISRVDIARRVLKCDTFSIANLYPAALRDSNSLPKHVDQSVWELGREGIQQEILRSDTADVLLGYGVQHPSGAQRESYREQLRWLASELNEVKVRVWVFGDSPAHPSRWQRIAHRHLPGASVENLAPKLLRPFALDLH